LIGAARRVALNRRPIFQIEPDAIQRRCTALTTVSAISRTREIVDSDLDVLLATVAPPPSVDVVELPFELQPSRPPPLATPLLESCRWTPTKTSAFCRWASREHFARDSTASVK
jgi:hypothetical protein